MKQSFIYVGLDVDDTLYHGSAFDQHTGTVIDFHCRPTRGVCTHLADCAHPVLPLGGRG